MEYALIQGVEVPKLGIGTWNMRGSDARQSIASALELGYRHIDTAEMYRNEREIGAALADSDVPRDDLFVVSKVWTNHLRTDEVMAACDQSLNRLGTDYLDLYLIHWPSDSVPIEETMTGMSRLLEAGRALNVGVSNFSVEQMDRASQALGSTIFCNQVKLHINHRQDPVVEYCQANDILVTAYTPLNKGRVGRNGVLKEISGKYGKSETQVALRWLVQQDKLVAIPKASSRDHQASNIDIFDFELTAEEMDRIDRAA